MSQRSSVRCCAAVAALAAVATLSTIVHAQQQVKDRDLIDAGFIMRIADTPAKMERLRSLPSHRFVARTTNGQRYYIYADPTDCKCAFVGYQKAFDVYRDMVRPPAPPPGMQEFNPDAVQGKGNFTGTLMVDEMNEDAGLMDGDDIFHLKFD